MARTSAVPEPSATISSGATILPGVPLPAWALPAEPLLPDPPPGPTPAPVPEPAVREMAMAGAPAAVAAVADAPSASVAAPVAAPPRPPEPTSAPSPVAVSAPVLTVAGPLAPPAPPAPPGEPLASAPVESRPHSHRRDGSTPSPLDQPVPALAPADPVPTRAEVYAAAGAAPPTAPWGTPPAPLPENDDAPPELAPPEGDAVADLDPDLDADPDLDPGPLEEDLADEATNAPRVRRPIVALGAVAGIAVLGAAACFVWPGFLVAQDDTVAAPVRTAAPVVKTVTLAAPQSVNGLTLLPGAPSAALTKAATSTRLTGYTAPVAAVYGAGTTPTATVIAWKAATPGTTADVSTAFAGFQGATGFPVGAVTPVPTGTLGGDMSCGASKVGATPASVCFWSDAATFGSVTVLRPATPTDGAAMAIAIRSAMEKVS